jgi:pyridoxamine 5'-phosphate oxidase
MFRFIRRWLPSREEISAPGKLLGQSITLMRREFSGKPFDESLADPDPVNQFEAWFSEAVETEKFDPNAMTLSTVSADGIPTARVVLLKEYDQKGFIFYTSYASRKGQELDRNPGACLLFFWPELIRQVRIEGTVEMVSREMSASYFSKRPRASQLSALASPQSQIVDSRSELEKRVDELDQQYSGKEIPLPPDWGGYILKPSTFEFWQGRVNRLHDRICYSRSETGNWIISRLAP